MARYRVTHEDGRTTLVHSDDPAHVKRQANHAETSRCVIADRTGRPRGPEPSIAVSIEKLKD